MLVDLIKSADDGPRRSTKNIDPDTSELVATKLILFNFVFAGEAKNLPGRSHGAACHRDIYCVLSLDQEEIFRTSTMERTLK